MKSDSGLSDQELDYYLCLAPLVKGVFSNITMTEMMAIIEDIMRRPVMVIDMGFKVINESPSINDNYKLFVRSDIFLVEECVFKLRASHIYWNLQKREFSSTLIKCKEYENFVVASIKTNSTDVMMLIIFENGIEFEKRDYELIKRICSVLSVQYQKEGIAFYSHMVFPNHIVFALLNGENVSREEFNNRVDCFPWIEYDEHYIMLLDLKEAGIDFRPRHALVLKSILAFMGENHCLTYKNLIIGFLGAEQFRNIYVEKRSEFERFLNANNMICSISQPYNDIMDSRKYYISAVLLMYCMRKYKLNFSCFADSHFYIVHELIARNYGTSLFYHPVVIKLIDYDREYNSNMLDTLKQYLECKSNPDLAAERLFIHRSTLFYRIKKIKELTGFDAENGKEAAQILFSMELYKIDNNLKNCRCHD